MNPKKPVSPLIALLPTVLVGCFAALTPALAAESEGRRLAAQWCAQCHQISPHAPTSDQAPPFPSMAKDPAYSEARLRNWLSDPHPPMPNIPLSRQEIELLIRFIQSSDSP